MGFNEGMTQLGKPLIVAAVLVGASGLFLDTSWALVAIGADLLLLASAVALAWRAHRADAPVFVGGHRARIAGGVVNVADGEDPFQYDAGYYRGDGDGAGRSSGPSPTPKVAPRRSRRLVRDFAAPTSRIRRRFRDRASAVQPFAASLVSAGGVAAPAEVSGASDGRRWGSQAWWWLAGLAASIPVGVFVNMLTGWLRFAA